MEGTFALPESLTELSVEGIQELIETARAEFNTLNETDDLSDETLDAMTELADAIDELHAETTGRIELATKLKGSFFSKVFRLTDGAKAFQRKAKIAARILPVQLTADTVEFNLSNLESALDHVDDAIDDLEDDQVGSALSAARAAKSALKKALGSKSDKSGEGDYHKSDMDQSSGDGGDGGIYGGYSAKTIELNLAKTKNALENVNDAIDALEEGNPGSALSNLRTASEQLENAIDDYDGDYDFSLLNSLAANGTTTDLKADTEEFASCSSARKRVSKARRSLRSALRALAKCSGYRVVVGPPPEPTPAPPPAASLDGVEEFSDGFPASDYAYIYDKDQPSTWTLRLTSTPGGDPDAKVVSAAVLALAVGQLEIPADDLISVTDKIRAAWFKANPGKTEDDLPLILKLSPEEFYNKNHSPEDGRFTAGTGGSAPKGPRAVPIHNSSGEVVGYKSPPGGSTADGRNSTNTGHPGYAKAHKFMADDQARAEKAVEDATGLKAKNKARETVSSIRAERVRWAAEGDRLGERIDGLEKQLEAANGLAAKNKVREVLSDANRELRAHINNKTGRYTGFTERN